ncbi:MAG: hypothetical protein AAFR00_03960 [Pseudomonadota bacterium]
MQFRRWRVIAGPGLVNAGLAASVFFLASCGSDAPAPTDAPQPAPQTDNAATDNGIVLPAVWSTNDLGSPIRDIALSGGDRSILAVAYEGRGFQLFNLEGEKLGDRIGFGVEHLASGISTSIDEAAVTLFPGVNRDGALTAYIYGDNLLAPVEIALPIDTDGEVAGLCSGSVGADSTSVLNIGFWTQGAETTLVTGTISTEGGAFKWTPNDTTMVSSPLAACRLPEGDASAEPVFGDQAGVASMVRPAGRFVLTLTDDGRLLAARPREAPEAVTLREGLSVRVPIPPVAIDALGTPRDGGYPFGMVALAGSTAPGVHQVVFVDTEPLVSPEPAPVVLEK